MKIAQSIAQSIFVTLALCLTLSACTQKGESPNATLRAGDHPFAFDYTQVKDLLIVKSDPATEEHWTARVEKNVGDREGWTLRAATQRTLADQVAKASLIEHLLDTLNSLQVEQIPDRVDPRSQGLETPAFALKWEIPGRGSLPAEEAEIRFGATYRAEGRPEGRFAGIRVGNRRETTAVVTGSTLKLIPLIDSLTSLRHAEWATEHVDDVDEAEFRKKGKLVLYAQREGDTWTDRRHKPYKQDLTRIVDSWLRAPIGEFVDDAARAAQEKAAMEKTAIEFELTIKDRHGNPTVLRARTARIGEVPRLVAFNSRRPGAAFILAVPALDYP